VIVVIANVVLECSVDGAVRFVVVDSIVEITDVAVVVVFTVETDVSVCLVVVVTLANMVVDVDVVLATDPVVGAAVI